MSDGIFTAAVMVYVLVTPGVAPKDVTFPNPIIYQTIEECQQEADERNRSSIQYLSDFALKKTIEVKAYRLITCMPAHLATKN